MKCSVTAAAVLAAWATAVAATAWAQVTPGSALATPSRTVALSDGTLIDQWTSGGYVGMTPGDYDWWYGCSPTSAGMLISQYDRNGYASKSYRNLVPGGVAEATTFGAANWSALSQSAIASQRHVSDFYVNGYNASGDDKSGAPTGALNCLADFMGTSQDAYGNVNGSTQFWYYNNGAALPLSDLYAAGPSYYNSDGAYGIYEYLRYRGYQQSNPAVETGLYSQYISGYNGNTQGFTFDQYKAEINAGRPVIIQVDNHSMLGVGYDSSVSGKIYVRDTWSAGPHEMTWGGSYSGLAHYGVVVVNLDGVGAEDNAVGGTCNMTYSDNGFATGASGGNTSGLSGNHLAATVVVGSLDPGSDGWASLKFFYSDQELSAAGIADESKLRMYWWNGTSSQWQFDGTGTFYAGAPQGGLGDYGVDLAGNYAWINVGHGSEWSLSAVPEPSTFALCGVALALAAVGWWRRRAA